MILFDLMINFIESFMFSYFLAYYFDVKHKGLYIFITSTLQLFLLTYANLINENGILLSTSVIILMVSSLILWKRKIQFDYIYIVLLYNCFIIIIALLGIFIINLMTYFNPLISTDCLYIIKCVISKIVQITLTILFIKYKVNLSTSLDIREWSIVIGFDFILLMILVVDTYTIVSGYSSQEAMSWILILSFGSSILYRYIIHKIDELNKERVEYARMEELSKYNSEKLTMIKHVTEEMSKNDHRIFYMLLQMEGYLENQEYDKLKTVIEGYRNLVTKYKLVTNTQNPVFDSLYSMKINDLILKEKNIKNSIFISRRIEYDHLPLIDFITGVLDFFNDCQTIMISMNEVGDTLVVRVIYREGIIDEKRVRNYLENKLPKGNVSLENHATKGVRFSIDLGDFNEA